MNPAMFPSAPTNTPLSQLAIEELKFIKSVHPGLWGKNHTIVEANYKHLNDRLNAQETRSLNAIENLKATTNEEITLPEPLKLNFDEVITPSDCVKLDSDGDVVKAVHMLYKKLESCSENDSLTCFKDITKELRDHLISAVIKEGQTGESETAIEKGISDIYDNYLEQFQNITVLDSWNYLKENMDHMPDVTTNLIQVGFLGVSYALLLKNFNRLLPGTPPSYYNRLEKQSYRMCRNVGLTFFASLAAPLLLFSTAMLIPRQPILSVNFPDPITFPNTEGGELKKANFPVAFMFIFNKFKNLNYKYKVCVFITAFVTLYSLGWLKYLGYIKDFLEIYSKTMLVWLSFSIVIFACVFILILYWLDKRKREASTDSQGRGGINSSLEPLKMPAILPDFMKIKELIDFFNSLINNQTLFNIYKNFAYGQLALYLSILIFVYIFL